MKKIIFKRKDLEKDLSTYKKAELAISDICALTEEEFLIEHDKCMSEIFNNSPEFDRLMNDWLKVEDWKKHFDGIFPSGPTKLSIDGYSNYKELLEEAHMYADFIAKRAYAKKRGRLHRSSSRISILLSITAAEDFANLQCARELGWNSKRIGKESLITKWQTLIPEFDELFPDFKKYLKIRNESIIHFKNSDTLQLKHIIDLNYENAKCLAELVVKMTLKYKCNMRDAWDIVDPNNFYNHFIQYIEHAVEMVNEINKSGKSDAEDNIATRP